MDLTGILSVCGNYIHEIYGPLNMSILPAEVFILLYFILDIKQNKNGNRRRGGWNSEASAWEVTNSLRAGGRKINKYGLVPICHPIRGLHYLSTSLIASRQFNPSIAAAFRHRQTGCHCDYVYLFRKPAGTWRQLGQIDSPEQLSLDTEGETAVKNKYGGCMAFFCCSWMHSICKIMKLFQGFVPTKIYKDV